MLPTRTTLLIVALLLTLSTAVFVESRRGANAAAVQATPAPEFTSLDPADWINGPPQRLADLRGRVVMLDVWTFACWNCYRSFPWLRGLEARHHRDGLRVIGIHSPELAHERDRAAVAAKVVEFELDHPVLIDNDFRYWDALGNRVWPSFYLIDKQGLIRYRFIGETHAGDTQARRIERAVEALLAEPARER
jgi:thiol-disulfide isomerase/thioredoxin